MWQDEGPSDAGFGRASAGSEVVIISDQEDPALVPPSNRSYISNMNFTNSPGARIGNNFLSVTNISHSDEVVKDVPCHKFMWAYVKNHTRAEQICCSVAVVALVACVVLAVYFGVFYNRKIDSPSKEPWFIKREEWLAEAFNNTDIDPEFEPLRLIVIQHSASSECLSFAQCCSQLRNTQGYYFVKYGRDIPYNFIVGNDGRVYEGQGWRKSARHTLGFNPCSLGIGFIGDYRSTQVTDLQQKRTHKLLEEGVKSRLLHPDFKVVGAKDVTNTESPGHNLYRAIQKWPQYDFTNRFYNKTCEEINAMPFP